MDETYIKVGGQWKYLYRAVDKAGNTIDFLLRAQRDKAAARRYFEKAIERNGEPGVFVLFTRNLAVQGAEPSAAGLCRRSGHARVLGCQVIDNLCLFGSNRHFSHEKYAYPGKHLCSASHKRSPCSYPRATVPLVQVCSRFASNLAPPRRATKRELHSRAAPSSRAYAITCAIRKSQ
jgi:hypothetical protein